VVGEFLTFLALAGILATIKEKFKKEEDFKARAERRKQKWALRRKSKKSLSNK